MKRAITTTLALTLFASVAGEALAQDGGYNPSMRRTWRNNPDNVQPQQERQRPDPAPAQRARDDDGDRRGDRDRNAHRRDHDGDRREARRDWDRRDHDRREAWSRDHSDWERHRPRYDPRRYPRTWRAPQRYRGFVYRPPPGFYVRSWGYGEVLPRGWYGPQYRILDWWSYGLPIPPIGYDWVRVGDDVLLVDSFTGRIVQVVRNLFW